MQSLQIYQLVTLIMCMRKQRLNMRRYLCGKASLSRAELKFLNESAQEMAEKQSHSWFLASELFLWPACCASVLSVDARMCHDVHGISIYSKQRKRENPRITHGEMKVQFKHKLSAHIHNFSPPTFDLSRADPSPSSLFRD